MEKRPANGCCKLSKIKKKKEYPQTLRRWKLLRFVSKAKRKSSKKFKTMNRRGSKFN